MPAWLQFGESGSETLTLLRARVPVFVTVIVKLAVAPLAIVCGLPGSFVIEIAGVPVGQQSGVRVAFSFVISAGTRDRTVVRTSPP